MSCLTIKKAAQNLNICHSPGCVFATGDILATKSLNMIRVRLWSAVAPSSCWWGPALPLTPSRSFVPLHSDEFWLKRANRLNSGTMPPLSICLILPVTNLYTYFKYPQGRKLLKKNCLRCLISMWLWLCLDQSQNLIRSSAGYNDHRISVQKTFNLSLLRYRESLERCKDGQKDRHKNTLPSMRYRYKNQSKSNTSVVEVWTITVSWWWTVFLLYLWSEKK